MGIIFCAIIVNVTSTQLNAELFSITPIKLYECFELSYNQITDSLLASWESTFKVLDIKENPFAQMIFFIRIFSELDCQENAEYFSINEILSKKTSNLRSNILATCAIMQRLGWDVQYFYNIDEQYLGINFTDDWKIRKGDWIEKDGKKYYLKEFDDRRPVGELKTDAPAFTFNSLRTKGHNLRPFPLIKTLPKIQGIGYEKKLNWWYKDNEYQITISIPKEQVDWVQNLPISIYGMVSSGINELRNIGLIDKLKKFVDQFNECDQVDFLLKFCQTEKIFHYDERLPIVSVSQQLLNGSNDCDGRSVFLYCLLREVLEYPDSAIIFISWHNHLTLGLRPRAAQAEKTLKQDGFYVGDKYYILDAAYLGETHWGSKMPRLSEEYEIIKKE